MRASARQKLLGSRTRYQARFDAYPSSQWSHLVRCRKLQRQAREQCRAVLVYAAKAAVKEAKPSQNKKQAAERTDKYTLWTEGGLRVLAIVEKQKKQFVLTVTVPGDQEANGFAIVWGTYRSSAAKWFNPEEVVASGSTSSRNGSGLQSQLSKTKSGEWETQLRMPDKLAPVYLAFQLESRGADGEAVRHRPSRGAQHFAVPVGLGKGNPLKYGASIAAWAPDRKSCSLNFAVVSRHATAMSLAIARRDRTGAAAGFLEIALDPVVNRKGDVWHARLDGMKDLETLCWGWRADADISWDMGNRFHPGQIMLDPHAALASSVHLPEGVNVPPPKKGLPAGSSNGAQTPAFLGCLSFLQDSYDWEGTERPKTFLEDSLILEVDIPSFVGSSSPVPADQKGKYLGLLAAVKQIKAVGVTAVMLTPVALSGHGLGPFSRAPYSFFAPEVAFASSGEVDAAARELRQLIRGFHKEGIEVYLQVEFCLTGEGWDENASAVSLRGLDAAVYYRAKGVLNCGHANVRALILASLLHWARTYQVDGFCFVNAETLTLDRDGIVLDNPPLAEDIANHGELRQLKLIAWAADDSLLPREGKRGFPHWATWLERNKRFSADFSSFFTGAGPPAIASSIATRICGSPDLFGPQWGEGFPGGLATGRRAAFGLNSASYLDKSNLSATVASILPTKHPHGQDHVLAKTLLFVSFICQGTPLIGADIFVDPSLVEFVAQLKQLRHKLTSFLRPFAFETEQDLRWYGSDPGRQPDWTGEMAASGTPGAAYLAFSVHGEKNEAVYVALNPYEGPVPAILPQPPIGSQWRRAVDTSDTRRAALPENEWIALSASDYTVSAKAALLLVAVPLPVPKQPMRQVGGRATRPSRPPGPGIRKPLAAASKPPLPLPQRSATISKPMPRVKS